MKMVICEVEIGRYFITKEDQYIYQMMENMKIHRVAKIEMINNSNISILPEREVVSSGFHRNTIVKIVRLTFLED